MGRMSEPRTLDYVVAALYRLGGSTRSVDIEDIAMETFKLAPHKFRWRKYPDQVDLAQVRDGLSDARKSANGELLVGDRKHGWTLTPAGQQAAVRLGMGESEEETDTARLRLDVPVRAAERQRVHNSRAWGKITTGESVAVTKQEIRELLRVDRYVTDEKYQQRLAIVL